MFKQKLISVIVPFTNIKNERITALNYLLDAIDKQDLRITDANNQATAQRAYEFIFVEHETDTKTDTRNIADKHIIVKSDKAFNKSWLMNIGARHATTNILCFIDSDMLFGKEYLSYCYFFREGLTTSIHKKMFIGWDWILKMPGKSEPVARMVRGSALTAGGVFFIDKDFYWQCGGMNENYFGYGGEDNDFWIRANSLLGKKTLKNILNCNYPLVHQYHDDAVPSQERFYHLDRTHEFTETVISRLRSANLGNIEHTTKVDVSDLVPTKPTIASKDSKGII
jgi:predicted glycosyltransferase involved in capsule biosynthesis